MKLIISCLLLLVLVALSHQETCTSNLYIETETPSLIGQCPVGYVNQAGKCNAFSALYKEKRTSTTCSLTTDCLFTSLECYNQKCTPKFRLVGDACVKDSQCLYQKTSSITSLFDLLNIPKCFNGKCALVKKESTKKNGETCGTYDSTTNTFYDCEGGYTCGITLTGGKCIPIVTAKKGESCYPVLDGSKSIVCESGTTCKVSLTSAICVAEIQQDQPCIKLALDANYVPCAAGLTCRQKSNSDTSNTCQRWASYGDYCSIVSDCAFVNSGMVDCVDNKCKRIYSAPIGQTCKDNKECYTSYCSAEGKCADPSELKCSDSLACPILYGSQCACGGKAFSTTSGGKCAAACTGAYYDVMSCIYNLGIITPTSSMVGSGISQYVDEDSSMFTRCRYAYNRYYSCLRQSWTKAGIATKGDMDGVSLNSYSATDSGLLPERSAANIQIVSFAVLMIASLFLVLF